jgi:hypothetical protein
MANADDVIKEVQNRVAGMTEAEKLAEVRKRLQVTLNLTQAIWKLIAEATRDPERGAGTVIGALFVTRECYKASLSSKAPEALDAIPVIERAIAGLLGDKEVMAGVDWCTCGECELDRNTRPTQGQGAA